MHLGARNEGISRFRENYPKDFSTVVTSKADAEHFGGFYVCSCIGKAASACLTLQ
jgi:hypothetical protein